LHNFQLEYAWDCIAAQEEKQLMDSTLQIRVIKNIKTFFSDEKWNDIFSAFIFSPNFHNQCSSELFSESILVCLTKRVSERTSDYKEDIIFSRDFLSTSAIDSVICFFRGGKDKLSFGQSIFASFKIFHISLTR
jgi:hypothetical protein